MGIAAMVEIPASVLGFVRAYPVFDAAAFDDDPHRALEQGQAAAETEYPLLLLLWIGVVLWQEHIWPEGLVGAYDLDVSRMNLAAGVTAAISLFLVVSG